MDIQLKIVTESNVHNDMPIGIYYSPVFKHRCKVAYNDLLTMILLFSTFDVSYVKFLISNA